jgi:hypothetical protein
VVRNIGGDLPTVEGKLSGINLEEDLTYASLNAETEQQEHTTSNSPTIFDDGPLDPGYIIFSAVSYNEYTGHPSASDPQINSAMSPIRYADGNIGESMAELKDGECPPPAFARAIQHADPPAAVDPDGNQCTVERLPRKRVHKVRKRMRVQYLVKWE